MKKLIFALGIILLPAAVRADEAVDPAGKSLCESRLAAIDNSLDLLRGKAAALSVACAALPDLKAGAAEAKLKLDKVEEETREANAKLQSAITERDGLKQQLDEKDEKLAGLVKDLATAKQARADAEAEAASKAGKANELEKTNTALNQQLDENDGKLAAMVKDLATAKQAWTAAEGEAQKSAAEAADQARRADELAKSNTALKQQFDEDERKNSHLGADLRALQDRLTPLETALRKLFALTEPIARQAFAGASPCDRIETKRDESGLLIVSGFANNLEQMRKRMADKLGVPLNDYIDTHAVLSYDRCMKPLVDSEWGFETDALMRPHPENFVSLREWNDLPDESDCASVGAKVGEFDPKLRSFWVRHQPTGVVLCRRNKDQEWSTTDRDLGGQDGLVLRKWR